MAFRARKVSRVFEKRAPDQQRKGSVLEVDRVSNKFVLKNFRSWIIQAPVLRPASSLLVKGS